MNYDELDQGIKDVVKWLRENGFNTTDSGDGESKRGDPHALEYPHVFMLLEGPHALASEARRLMYLCEAKFHTLDGITIEASYSPIDGHAVLMLAGVNDFTLALAPKED